MLFQKISASAVSRIIGTLDLPKSSTHKIRYNGIVKTKGYSVEKSNDYRVIVIWTMGYLKNSEISNAIKTSKETLDLIERTLLINGYALTRNYNGFEVSKFKSEKVGA